jgi:hypothetical protein
MGIGIVGDTQETITPFQRQVFEAEQSRRAEAKEEKLDQAQSGGGGRRQNSMAGGTGPTTSRSETIRYETDGERDDDDVLEVI